MTNKELYEEIGQIAQLLADTPIYKNDPQLWEAVSNINILLREIVARLPEDSK